MIANHDARSFRLLFLMHYARLPPRARSKCLGTHASSHGRCPSSCPCGMRCRARVRQHASGVLSFTGRRHGHAVHTLRHTINVLSEGLSARQQVRAAHLVPGYDAHEVAPGHHPRVAAGCTPARPRALWFKFARNITCTARRGTGGGGCSSCCCCAAGRW